MHNYFTVLHSACCEGTVYRIHTHPTLRAMFTAAAMGEADEVI